jgi:histidinol-phosphate aminotransferase
MTISRRTFFGTIGSGAAAIALPGLTATSHLALAVIGPQPLEGGSVVHLNLNENAYGCANSVLKAIRTSAPNANRYAASEYAQLTERLAKLHNVKAEQIVLGCGSGEVLRMAANAFLSPGTNVVVALPTFGALSKHAKTAGAEIREIPLAEDWSHDLMAMRAHVDGQTRLIYICNPNNPTGSLTARKDLDTFLGALPETTHVLIDEAYHHYVSPSGLYSSFLDQPAKSPRVIVARTFSKIYGLAGMRIGYGVASTEVATLLQAQQLPQSLNILAIPAAHAALDDTAWVQSCFKKNADDRQEFFNQANARMLRAIDSHTNFGMLNIMRRADEVIEHFAKNGVLVGRKFPPLGKYIRVTFGTSEGMEKFWKVWDGMHIEMRM